MLAFEIAFYYMCNSDDSRCKQIILAIAPNQQLNKTIKHIAKEYVVLIVLTT